MAEIVQHRDSIGQDKPVIVDRQDNERALIRTASITRRSLRPIC